MKPANCTCDTPNPGFACVAEVHRDGDVQALVRQLATVTRERDELRMEAGSAGLLAESASRDRLALEQMRTANTRLMEVLTLSGNTLDRFAMADGFPPLITSRELRTVLSIALRLSASGGEK